LTGDAWCIEIDWNDWNIQIQVLARYLLLW
jgi:hypothetical protein